MPEQNTERRVMAKVQVVSDLRDRWNWLRRGNLPALIDALRRSTELLDHAEMQTPHASEERDYIIAVNRRLVRGYDPKARTDRAAR